MSPAESGRWLHHEVVHDDEEGQPAPGGCRKGDSHGDLQGVPRLVLFLNTQ